MKQVNVLILFMIAICFSMTATAQENRYNPEMFENEERDEWQKVDQVIKAIGLSEGDHIADIGGGSGYFARPFAKRVGQSGVVYVCDIATDLMDYLQEKAQEENINNLVTVYADLNRPMLFPNSVNYIFFCNTNHHLDDRVEYYKNLKPLLKSGGKIVVVDWKNKEQEVGPPPGHTMPKQTVLDEMKEAGFELTQEETFLPYQYFLIFEAD